MAPDLLQALLNNSHLLIMLPCFIWLFHRLERMEERIDATIANSNARLDQLYSELISLRKGG